MATFDAEQRNHDLNQYWYSPTTIRARVDEALLYGHRIAFLSTPSLYFALTPEQRASKQVALFEYDRAWASDPGFVFFDFNRPDQIPASHWNQYDYIVVDPPFITRDVWEKYVEAVKTLGLRDMAEEARLRALPESDGAIAPGTSPFRVLFTTVLENHAMLEGLLGQALFIPDFRPTVEHLVYQYSCFLNYPHTTGDGRGLAKVNQEIPAEEAPLLAARRMANDLRESEQQLHAQMRDRDRTGEQPLPTAVPSRTAGAVTTIHGQRFVEAGSLAASDPAMKWTHVPAGLTEFAGGAASAAPAEEIDPADIGPAYVGAQERRDLLEQFKRVVDTAFKTLDVVVRAGPDTKAATHQSLIDLTAKMRALSTQYSAATGFDAHKDGVMAQTMISCADSLSGPAASEWTSKKALPMSADATRLYKSPVFNRQKELLAEMKMLKKAYLEAKARP
jgi:hypothetical protein